MILFVATRFMAYVNESPSTIWIAICICISTFLFMRLTQSLPYYRRVRTKKTIGAVSTMIYWGSGGHTTEMIQLISRLNPRNYQPFYFVTGHSDVTSQTKILSASLPYQNLVSWRTVYRSREVRQSWISTVFTSLYSAVDCFVLIAKLRPQLIICNGPGTCVFLCYAAFALRVLGVYDPQIIFVESFCRVKSLSFSGKLLYPIVDKFVVQWPGLAEKYRRAEYIGRIC
jgi:beta-1,4-N-acetylglucosaminyltransferase